MIKISPDINENLKILNDILPIKQSFDVIAREIIVDKKKSIILFIDGFVKDTIMVHVMKELQKVNDSDDDSSMKLYLSNIPYIEATITEDMNSCITDVLSGQLAIFVDGNDSAVLVDTREYPAREPSESHIEKVTRGPRDDLVETIVFNTALIRRRIRDPKLTFEITKVGTMSKTDVAIGYIGGVADEKLLKKVKDRLNKIDVHALTMGEKSLEEILMKKKWYNPMPLFRVSERPDTIAAHIMEGHIVLLVDTSPTALILPTTLFYFTQYVEDYYQTPIAGTFTRIFRMFAIPVAIFLTPIYILINAYPDSQYNFLSFLVPTEVAEISIFAQVLIIEFWLEILRLSSLHTPQNMESAFSIIGGLILGDFAVSIGLFVADSILFAVAAAICNHCIPNPEFGNAAKLFRWMLILLSGIFGIYGFGAGVLIILLIICTTKTFDDSHPYLWPLIPFNFQALKHLLVRYPLARIKNSNKDK